MLDGKNPKTPTFEPCSHIAPDYTTLKQIGSTIYRVNIHFSRTITETVNEKVLCLIKFIRKMVV